jgi:hypothetical protein
MTFDYWAVTGKAVNSFRDIGSCLRIITGRMAGQAFSRLTLLFPGLLENSIIKSLRMRTLVPMGSQAFVTADTFVAIRVRWGILGLYDGRK